MKAEPAGRLLGIPAALGCGEDRLWPREIMRAGSDLKKKKEVVKGKFSINEIVFTAMGGFVLVLYRHLYFNGLRDVRPSYLYVLNILILKFVEGQL